MSKKNNKSEEGIQIPLWYLRIESKFLKYQRRIMILSLYGVLGVYVWIPFISPEFQISIEDVFVYYIVVYVFYFIVGYILYKFLYKKYELNPSELFAYNIFKVYRSLEKVHLDSGLITSLKRDLRSLVKEMKFIKRKHLNLVIHENFINSLTVCIKNLPKINTSDENSDINLGIANALCIMSEKVYKSKKIDAIEEELQRFSEGLKAYPKIKLTDKALDWKKNISDNFQVYGFILMIIFIIAIYAYPEHQLVLSVFLIGIVTVWLSRIIMK